MQIYSLGEKLRVEDLLYAMLLPSANDAANVLAEHVAGSISEFAELMNSKAKEIGCMDSNFANPSGIHDENLYSTAHDLSLIARYAMNIKTFRKIVNTSSYTLPSTSVYPNDDRVLTLSNYLMNSNYKDYYYEYATGVKTGYTNAAKDCLIASAKKDDVEFIIVVLGAGNINGNRKTKYLDCKTLFNFAFDNYTAHYKNLQEEKKKEEEKKLQEETSLTSASVSENPQSSNSGFLRGISKIIAVISIILAIRILFRRPKKKKNHYRYGGKKKNKHRAKH